MRAIQVLAVAAGSAACGAHDAGTGLPGTEFQRAFSAGLAVAAAERCGEPVDGGRVRYELVKAMLRQGQNEETAERSGRAFDKTRSEYALKIAARPDFCVSAHVPQPERIEALQRGSEVQRP